MGDHEMSLNFGIELPRVPADRIRHFLTDRVARPFDSECHKVLQCAIPRLKCY